MSRLVEALVLSLRKHGRRNLVSLKGDFVYRRYTYAKVLDLSLRFASYLRAQGIRKGDRICICSYNCPEYFAVLLGSMFSGVIVVPVDFSSTWELTEKYMRITGSGLLVSSRKKAFCHAGIFYIEDAEEALQKYSPGEIANVKDSDVLEILFTSGTTGEPKGVVLSHENIHSNAVAALSVFRLNPGDRLLSIIPLSHSLEQSTGFFCTILSGAHTTQLKARRPSEMLKAMKHERITIIVAVPAFFTLIKKKIEENARKSGRMEHLKRGLSFAGRLPLPARRLLFHSIHKALGGSLRCAVSGGAPLPPETEMFWNAAGIPLVNGYGLTETSPILTLNRLEKRVPGSVGEPIPGIELRISGQGEILAKGKSITRGYYQNEEATRALFSRGWLRTGDCGDIRNGFLYIKGRLKNMILSPNGLNVYPEDIESVLNASPLVKESCVLGIARGTDVVITAVILPERHTTHPGLKKLVAETNERLEPHQRIQDFAIWPGKDFPRTFTMKVKRREVESLLVGRQHTESEARDELLSILSSLSHRDAAQIRESSLLYRDLGFDSLKCIELSTMIEEKLGVDIDESMVDSKTTVKRLRSILSSEKADLLELDRRMFSPVYIPAKHILPEIAYFLISRYFTSFSITGRENLENLPGQVIIVTNHTSHLDAPVIFKHLPLGLRCRLATAAAADYFFVQDNKLRSRITSFAFSCIMGAFPMSRDTEKGSRTSFRKSLEFVGEIADRGWSIALAPEGTRTRDGKMGRFKSGIGIIVKETAFPVIPIKVKGLYDIMPPHSRFPVKKAHVEIVIGKPLRFHAGLAPSEIAEQLEAIVRAM